MISVILPTFNRPKMLYRALKCVQAQTCQDYEVIVVNDAGEDVEDVVMRFPKAVYWVNDINVGLGMSRNAGIALARGEYLAYLDDDDLWFPEHLETLRDVVVSLPNCRAAYTDCYRWYNERQLFGARERKPWLGEKPRRIAAIISVMHERSVIDEIGGFADMRQMEDWDFLYRLSKRIGLIHIQKYTTVYSKRMNGSQLTDNREAMHMSWLEVRNRYDIGPPKYNLEVLP